METESRERAEVSEISQDGFVVYRKSTETTYSSFYPNPSREGLPETTDFLDSVENIRRARDMGFQVSFLEEAVPELGMYPLGKTERRLLQKLTR